MKKLSIVLLAIFFISIANANAQTDATIENVVAVEEVNLENHPKECPFTKNAEGKLVCVKTGKVCGKACKNKAKGTCCNGKKKTSCSKSKKSSCSKSKSGSFNFNKSNRYGVSGDKYSCNKTAKKKCCKKKTKRCGDNCRKPCCNSETKMTGEERIRIGIENGSITEEEGKKRLEGMKKE